MMQLQRRGPEIRCFVSGCVLASSRVRSGVLSCSYCADGGASIRSEMFSQQELAMLAGLQAAQQTNDSLLLLVDKQVLQLADQELRITAVQRENTLLRSNLVTRTKELHRGAFLEHINTDRAGGTLFVLNGCFALHALPP